MKLLRKKHYALNRSKPKIDFILIKTTFNQVVLLNLFLNQKYSWSLFRHLVEPGLNVKFVLLKNLWVLCIVYKTQVWSQTLATFTIQTHKYPKLGSWSKFDVPVSRKKLIWKRCVLLFGFFPNAKLLILKLWMISFIWTVRLFEVSVCLCF